MSTPQNGQIYGAICAIMKDVGEIAKGRKNLQQGYSFRGIDDVYNAMHKPLAEHGVFIVPSVIERDMREQPSKSGGVLFYTTLKVAHRFYAADGSYIEAVTCGEAMDSGDKSTNKAMSAAMKYAILEVFAMPTEGDNDTENHSHEVQRTPQRAAPPKATNTPPPAGKPATAPPNAGKAPPAKPPAGKQADQSLSLHVTEVPTGLTYSDKAGKNKDQERWNYKSIGAGYTLSTYDKLMGNRLDQACEAGEQLTIRYTQEEFNGTAYGKIQEIIEVAAEEPA